MRDSTEKSPSVDVVRDHCLEVRTDANNDEVKVQKERILPGENRFRAGTTLKRTLVSCAERPAKDGFPAVRKKGLRVSLCADFWPRPWLYCTGPMAVLGSISDGLRDDYLTLSIKSVLDGFLSIAFASTLGAGVAFSALPVRAYQGVISLLAAQLNAIVNTDMMNEMTATGGILLIGIGISSMLELKKIRVGNFLPALAIAPVIVHILNLVTK